MPTPTFDAATPSVQNAGGSPTTFSHTVANQPNRFLLVAVANRTATPSVSGITYAGVSLTQLAGPAAPSSPSIEVDLWYLVAPATGANNVVVTFAGGTPTRSVIAALSYYNVDQTTPFGTAATNNGLSGTNPQVTVSSAAGELVVDAMVWNKSTTITVTVDASQAQRVNSSTTAGSQEIGLGCSEEAGAASVSMDWTPSAGAGWGSIGVPLKPSADLPPGLGPALSMQPEAQAMAALAA